MRRMTDYFITPAKIKELKKELLERENTMRPEILGRVKVAKERGDLSENAEYHDARDEQRKNEERIKEIKTIVSEATIVKTHSTDIVGIGSTVTFTKDDGTEKTFTLVGPEEADMTAGKISFKSPIGGALMGKKVKEDALVQTPAGEMKYTIKKIV